MKHFPMHQHHWKALSSMAMLYAGKTSGLLVAFIFLPYYSRILGSEQFGVVAIILSLQALLMMLDLGMSTLVSREVAAGESSPAAILKFIRTAELGLTLFYATLLVISICLKLLGLWPSMSVIAVLSCTILFGLLVLQNIYYSAILAHRAYNTASTLQVAGALIRATVTAYILGNISATITTFVITQMILSALHFVITRHYTNYFLQIKPIHRPSINEAIELLKRGKSLALFSLAGAAVTQLDKSIISVFMPAAAVSPYFLATTFCMVPISILAGPISQYFQPMLINLMAKGDAIALKHILRNFTFSILLITVMPCLFFWLLREPIVDLWLGKSSINTAIVHYVAILLPGFALGALGFIPYSLLISVKDYKFQASLSATMTSIALIATTISAFLQSVEAVCYIYASYHASSTLLSWLRAMYLAGTREQGRFSFLLAVKCLGLTGILFAVILL